MHRQITILTLVLSYAGAAGAHTLGAGEGLAAQLWHELLGVHHLPLTLLLIVIGALAYRRFRARRRP